MSLQSSQIDYFEIISNPTAKYEAAGNAGIINIKLKKDKNGQHHYIPLSWVTSVENGKLKVDRPGEQAMQMWATNAPT